MASMKINTRSRTLFNFALKHSDKIDEVESDSDGYWIYLRPGWRMGDNVQHVYHDTTVVGLIRWFRDNAPVPCDCQNCK